VTEEQQRHVEEVIESAELVVEEAAPLGEAAPEGDVDAPEAADELAALRQELEETKSREAEYLDGWQRARAELANARKRFQREQEQAYANAKADLLVRLLPTVDDFELAFESLPDNPSSHNWVEGIRLIQQKLQGLLEQEGVTPIEATGHEFDPLLHQAVTHEPCEEVLEGCVIAEMQRGYKVGGRVLRPSVVRVSAGPPPEPEPEPEDDHTEEEATDKEQS
jgi:molecular chaperone GrpE